ncbi:MAG: choice-of-anchor D domain-containing protein [Acidobacteriia bacterium]|nr:choice-of-anchor D domain-containing protein [Terriglobia bacterium]
MKKLLLIPLLLIFSGLAFGQVPVCNGATANCTDYFGVANYANSPLPAGSILSYTLISGGSGYTAPAVLLSDPAGTGASPATAIVDPTTGAITGITGGTGGSGYIAPQVTITDPNGTGAMFVVNLTGPFTGGIRKFVDPLANLSLAVPDTTTFSGSDFYVIGLKQYTLRMHTDLPLTTLRGYCQLTDGSATATCVSGPSYLGPVIIAQKNRPVRILFRNMLPTGAGGNLFIPVDTTYMGAAFAQNRATLHLHGGNTPWISDGTPHQWTVPVGETGVLARGPSTQFVPDMFFDASGNLVPAGTAGATNDPGVGSMTFYWTNQQGGRLMFYHDHAYGITRLNVYAGEAAGYLLYDPAEEAALLNATAPGTIAVGGSQAAPDLAHLIPLVIQDKTFVPSAVQLAAEDPTWTAGGFGTTPGAANPGDLWFPHVYTTNQNPADPGGGNAFGRWDYGAWFFPPQTSLTAAVGGALEVPCTSAAFPGQILQPSATCPTCGCPITPNPSGTPEAFMDTPVVNGVAYPVLHVAPAAYRFQILSAGNDRSLHLSFFVADPLQNNTEVKMVPAVPATASSSTPLCTAVNPITQPGLVLGLARALLSGGTPLNGTGLPAGCWPNYGASPGIPAKQTMWAADGRAGGVPDPATAGPPWIQIGTEGGLLPSPVVIPATPINYEYNLRSITVTNVGVHGLWVGPAERADVIVDFSAFSGKTLILYNDAPAPAPAFDSRLDYFTGDGDQTPIGGAPNTQPGYGPNTRTIMQVVVDGNAPNNQAFSLSTLQAAFASSATTTGLFAATQPTTIVPESIYNSAYFNSFANTYTGISDNTVTFTPITTLSLINACSPSPVLPAQCVVMDQKAIQELFTLDYGRMNATLGTELPFTNFLTQTTIPLGYIDPPTEIFQEGETQIWKITHNGVDTHFIHFHLFNVQVINRMGWDGSIRAPDENEVGWKDTVRMNPLEDITVALQPIKPIVPWPLPDSIRLEDVTAPVGSSAQFTNVDPFTNGGATTFNGPTNFGWEYVWHCHILGHEENDMMRPMVFQVAPPAPSNLVALGAPSGKYSVALTWTDNSANESGFNLERDTDPAFLNPAPTSFAIPSTTTLAYGGIITFTDTTATKGVLYFYRVQAVDDNFKPPFTQAYNATPALLSAWSNTAPVVVGAAPNASVSPTPLTFGNQFVNTTSAAQTVTLSNAAGAGTLAIGGITITGANPGDFAQTNTCLASLPAGTSCTISVTFKPTATLARSASLTVNSSNPTLLAVPLSGTGIAPLAGVAPTSLTFASQGLNTPSAAQTVTLSNTGTAPLTISSFTPTGDFGIDPLTTTCSTSTSLAASTSCTIGVIFTPTVVGARTGTLTVTDNTNGITGSAQTVSLSGTGVNGPFAALSPASLPFGNQLVGTTSTPAQTVTLTNSGGLALTITSIATTGNFAQTNTCLPPGTLAAGANCTISVTFTPTTTGALSGTLTITDNSNNVPGSTQAVSLSGTGIMMVASVSPASLTFGSQVIGTSSAAQTVTLTNTGNTALTITGTGVSTNFNAPTTCPSSLAGGASCTFSVTFAPALGTPAGPVTGALTITDNSNNAPGSTQTVSLSGTVVTGPFASVSPASLTFANQLLNTTSASQPVTLKNTGSATLTGINVSTTTNFAEADNCGLNGSLAGGASCTINVTFTPTAAGPLVGSLIIFSNSIGGSPVQVPLSGTGIVPIAGVSPTSLTFANQKVNTTSAPQTVTLSNTGTAALTINSIAIGGTNPRDFSRTTTCGASLAAKSSCTISVTFRPSRKGARSATLTVTDNNNAVNGSTQNVALSGTGL